MNILSDMLSSAVVQRLGWTLLHSVWQFALIAILLSALLATLRRRSANARYLIACIGLVAMLTTSTATYWRLVACQTAEVVMTTVAGGAPPAERVDVRDEVVPDVFTESPSFASPELPDNAPSTAFAPEPALVGNDGPSSDVASATPATLPRRIIEGLAPWLPWVSLAWLGGVIVVSVRHLGGWVGVQRLRWVGTTEVDSDLSDHACQLMNRMKISRPVRILQSTLSELPIVVGWLRPAVLLPVGLLTGLSPKQLEAILAHELAHVRRYDYLFNLLQTAAETLLFYHPAVWWLSRRIRIEREHCCDDVAVAVCGNKVEYAEALAAVEQRRAAALAMAVGGRGRMGNALGRVRRVLGISTEDRIRWSQAIGGGVTVLMLIVVLVGYMAAASEAQRGEDHQAAEPSVPTSEEVDEPLAHNEGKNRVAQLVEQLGDEKYDRRHAAQRELIDMGEAAVTALKDALLHKDREVAVRAKHCLAEIDRRIETQRKEHRQAAAEAAKRSDPGAATRHYLALLALPDPPLCDCRAATGFFASRRDWESFAVAQEATAKEMRRVIHAPVEEFIRPAPPPDPARPVGRGPTVLVQTGLDGIWVKGKGGKFNENNWGDWLKRKQDRMKPDRLNLLVELGRLYRDRLGQPKKAVAALANAMCDVEFFTEPIDRVIAREWPIRSKEHKEVHGPIGGSYLNTLRELSEMQQQAGDLDGAIETKTRQLLAHFILCWGHRQKVSNRPAFELGSLLRKLPADAPLPPLFWINVLGPENRVITLDLDERSPLEMHDLNVLAKPGYVFDSLEVTADMEGLGGRGEVSCYTVIEKHNTLGRLRWHEDKRKGREELSQEFKIPPEVNLIRFEMQPWQLEGLQVHRVTVKATFRPGAGEPTEKEATAERGTKKSEIRLESPWPANPANDQPHEAMRGRVLDATGEPVAGAKVFLSGPQTLLLIDGKDEFRSRTPAVTDAQGRFALARDGGEKANRVIVTAPSLHVWIETIPRSDDELTIKLPEPAMLVLRYDIEGDLPEVRFRLQLDHTKKPGWTGVVDSIQYPVAENHGQVEVKLTPGSYGLARLKPLRWRAGEMDTFRKNAFCDQQTLEVKAGERKVVDFVRSAGRSILGEVVGVPEDQRKDAFVYVAQRADRREIPAGKERLSVVFPVGVLDAVTTDEAGQFTTARIPPGTYTVIAHVYQPRPHHRGLGDSLPDLVGTTRVTVPEDGERPKVRIELTPTSPEAVEGAADESRESNANETASDSPAEAPSVIPSSRALPTHPAPRKLFAAGHGDDVNVLAVAFSPNGKLVAALDQTAKVILRDAGTGEQIVTLDLLTSEEKELVFYTYPIRRILHGALAFSPGGKTLAAGADPVVKLYDVETCRPQLVLRDKALADKYREVWGASSEELKKLESLPHAHGRVHSIAFSPDGTVLATSGEHVFEASGATPGHLKLWDPKTGEMKKDLGLHFGAVRSATFTPDGKALASAGMHPPRWTSSVRFWDPRGGDVKKVLESPRGDPWSVAFSPDGKLLAVGGIVAEDRDKTSGMLLVWHAQTGALLLDRALPTAVTSVAFSADGKTLASGEYDRGVTLWDPTTRNATCKLNPIDPPSDMEGPVHAAFSPKGKLLAAVAEDAKQGGFVTVWDLDSTGR